MTTNILVSIAMAPFEPLEDREWAVIGGCVKNIGLRFRCHAQILIGRGGTDDFIICRDPASTVYRATVPHNHSKEGSDPRENRDASIPVVTFGFGSPYYEDRVT